MQYNYTMYLWEKKGVGCKYSTITEMGGVSHLTKLSTGIVYVHVLFDIFVYHKHTLANVKKCFTMTNNTYILSSKDILQNPGNFLIT